jgi:hypothetical protein
MSSERLDELRWLADMNLVELHVQLPNLPSSVEMSIEIRLFSQLAANVESLFIYVRIQGVWEKDIDELTMNLPHVCTLMVVGDGCWRWKDTFTGNNKVDTQKRSYIDMIICSAMTINLPFFKTYLFLVN